jgi:hypothetical protein
MNYVIYVCGVPIICKWRIFMHIHICQWFYLIVCCFILWFDTGILSVIICNMNYVAIAYVLKFILSNYCFCGRILFLDCTVERFVVDSDRVELVPVVTGIMFLCVLWCILLLSCSAVLILIGIHHNTVVFFLVIIFIYGIECRVVVNYCSFYLFILFVYAINVYF